MLKDNARDIEDARIGAQPNISATAFFQEMLLTYRLIFGQNSKSWQLFHKEMSRLAKKNRQSIFSMKNADPLLPILCGSNSEGPLAAQLYEDIDAEISQPYYVSDSFPFFSKKLLIIQGFIKQHRPHTLSSVWHDDRDEASWWSLWVCHLLHLGEVFSIN